MKFWDNNTSKLVIMRKSVQIPQKITNFAYIIIFITNI